MHIGMCCTDKCTHHIRHKHVTSCHVFQVGNSSLWVVNIISAESESYLRSRNQRLSLRRYSHTYTVQGVLYHWSFYNAINYSAHSLQGERNVGHRTNIENNLLKKQLCI